MATVAPKQRTSTPVRERVLYVASGIFVRRGPEALTVREVAAAAGCSTMMIYTWFGGKDELIEAIYLEGFRRLEAAQAACTSEGTPLVRLWALAHGYRSFALAHPALYAAMFSRPMAPQHVQGRRSRSETASFMTLLEAVRDARARGAFAAIHSAESIADVFWAAVHGHVSLEVTGHFAESAELSAARFALLVDACLSGMATAPTDSSIARECALGGHRGHAAPILQQRASARLGAIGGHAAHAAPISKGKR